MFTPAIFTRNNNFWRDPFEEFDSMFPAFWDNSGLEKRFAGFSTDVIERDGNYVLQAELPGFAKEDIHVDLKDNILTISASHNEEKNEEDKETKYIRRERHTSAYSRSFRVANVMPEDISASYKNGILEVVFPKRDALPEKEVKTIEIK
ncbi:MAG: Hsp20/alpha crystallin family protein [Lachnospiraceae bacterium]|nr:Hsp20/alpha crystallin family protein [Lachnospiraceae bacterium]